MAKIFRQYAVHRAQADGTVTQINADSVISPLVSFFEYYVERQPEAERNSIVIVADDPGVACETRFTYTDLLDARAKGVNPTLVAIERTQAEGDEIVPLEDEDEGDEE